jgi:hypothetical protein
LRTPLVRRIDVDESLNEVDVFLPFYNRAAVQKIIDYLHKSGDSAAADSIGFKETRVTLPLRSGMDEVIAKIETLPSWMVPTVRERKEVLRLVSLAEKVSSDALDLDAWGREVGTVVTALVTKRDALTKKPGFARDVEEEALIDLEKVGWATGESKISDAQKRKIAASDGVVISTFKKSYGVLGGDVALAYLKSRLAEDSGSLNSARLEAFALSRRPEVMRDINDLASERIDALFQAHGAEIDALPAKRRVVYERLREQAPEPFLTPIHLPSEMDFKKGEEAWEKHLYADESGLAPLYGNKLEAATIREALNDPSVVAWVRNEPRKPWSLCLRRRENNVWGKVFPDFLFVRREGTRLVVDIIDPHSSALPDAISKAHALAEYARSFGGQLGGHIDLIAQDGNRLVRIHLETEKARKEIEGAPTNEALAGWE